MAPRLPDRLRPPWRRRPRIYLHIGAMKTGTTYLQDLMQANSSELATAGILFPGERWNDQSLAAQDVLEFGGEDPRLTRTTAGRWAAIVTEMMAHEGPAAVFSMEFLSFADSEAAGRVVESFEDADVEIVLTVRDAARTIPAQWQTVCRNGGKVPYRRFVYGVQEALETEQDDEPGRAVRMFQRTQGIARMLDVWVPLVGAKHVHVVTVPPSGSDPTLLWRRFAEVVGVDPAVATRPVPNTNPSLGHASTELLRLLNVELGRLPRLDHQGVVKGPLARKILGSRAHLEAPLRLHRRGHVFASQWNASVRASVTGHGVPVTGDLDDLAVGTPSPDLPKTLYRPTDREIVEAAATARDGLLEFAEHVRSLVAAEDPGPGPAAQSFAPSRDWSTTPAEHWDGHDEPRQAAVAEVAELVRAAIALTHRLEDVRTGLAPAPVQDAATLST